MRPCQAGFAAGRLPIAFLPAAVALVPVRFAVCVRNSCRAVARAGDGVADSSTICSCWPKAIQLIPKRTKSEDLITVLRCGKGPFLSDATIYRIVS